MDVLSASDARAMADRVHLVQCAGSTSDPTVQAEGSIQVTRVVAISDIHGMIPPKGFVPECDLLLLGGDLTWHKDEETELKWLLGPFKEWLDDQPAKEIVAIAGNHDFSAVSDEDVWRSLPWHYLKDESIDLFDETIFGTPFSNKFGNWAFMGDEDTLAERVALAPDHTTILITHGPPKGMGDLTAYTGEHVGSAAFLHRTKQLVNLKLHVWGHIHEATSVWYTKHIGVNASYVDLKYKPRRAPAFQVEL